MISSSVYDDRDDHSVCSDDSLYNGSDRDDRVRRMRSAKARSRDALSPG